MSKKLVLVGCLAVAVAACGSSSKSNDSGEGGSGSKRTIPLKIVKAGCDPTQLTVTPGPANFTVTNVDADAITELEVMAGDKILGESENLTPGLSGKFSLTLKPGEYETKCPGGKSGKIVVSGTPDSTAATPGGANAAAVQSYRDYLEQESALLVSETREFTDAVKAGDVAKAKEEFTNARAHYESIEPVAESFGDLDPEIDAREGDVPDAEWGGFHRIEQQLWAKGNTTGMAPVADKLLVDVKELQAKIPGIELEPAQIANGAVELLNEVAKSKVTGEEDRYSHTDLYDFAAIVAGAKAAFAALEPVVAAKDPQLPASVNAKFAAVTAALAQYKNGDGYVLYDKLTKDDTKMLATKVDALADALAGVPPLVVGS